MLIHFNNARLWTENMVKRERKLLCSEIWKSTAISCSAFALPATAVSLKCDAVGILSWFVAARYFLLFISLAPQKNLGKKRTTVSLQLKLHYVISWQTYHMILWGRRIHLWRSCSLTQPPLIPLSPYTLVKAVNFCLELPTRSDLFHLLFFAWPEFIVSSVAMK